MAFSFTPTAGLPEVVLIESTRHGDDRGWFTEVYKRSVFVEHGIVADLQQDNHSLSGPRGTLRGLHYQLAPFVQGKLVRVVSGAIFDVAVDVRSGSKTLGQWISVTLGAGDGRMLWIPEGFAHGFQTLVADTEVLYKTTAEYSATHERGVRWDDDSLAIPWPVTPPVLSQRDRQWPALS